MPSQRRLQYLLPMLVEVFPKTKLIELQGTKIGDGADLKVRFGFEGNLANCASLSKASSKLPKPRKYKVRFWA